MGSVYWPPDPALRPHLMRLVLLTNPNSGRARNTAAVSELHARLTAAGCDVRVVCTGEAGDRLAAALREGDGAEALIIAWGDGSVHHAASDAIAADVPIYPFPLGTENLFAREFGATRSIDRLVRSVRSGRTRAIDAPSCNGRLFVLMCGIGFDAHVVERVARARKSGVRLSDYLRRGIEELREFRTPKLRVEIGGIALADDEAGLLLIANSPRYAARLNPCRDARPDDGRLDVLFMPYRSRAGLLAWLASVATGMHMYSSAARRARATSLRVSSTTRDVPIQLDGETVAHPGVPLDLRIEIESKRLRVLMP